jgi:hypothetical protein
MTDTSSITVFMHYTQEYPDIYTIFHTMGEDVSPWQVVEEVFKAAKAMYEDAPVEWSSTEVHIILDHMTEKCVSKGDHRIVGVTVERLGESDLFLYGDDTPRSMSADFNLDLDWLHGEGK